MTLDGTLSVDSREDSVAFRLTVRNGGDDDAELTFSDAQTVDFTVYDGDEQVWRYGEGRMFAQMLQTETIAPGGESTYDGTWTDPRPGEFEVVARLEATNADVEARASFSV